MKAYTISGDWKEVQKELIESDITVPKWKDKASNVLKVEFTLVKLTMNSDHSKV